jgi:hypothetical protein
VSISGAESLRFSVHGLAVEVMSGVPALGAEIQRALGCFEVPEWPAGFVPVQGAVLPYDERDVLRHVSPRAVRFSALDDPLELYAEEERFWVVDERWGMAEINLLKGQWRSWVLPGALVDPAGAAERAVLWPMAQLLRAKGLYMLPAISAVRDGWGVLILSGLGLRAELSTMMRAGYRLVGERWTALREEDGRVAMLHMPAGTSREGSALDVGCSMLSVERSLEVSSGTSNVQRDRYLMPEPYVNHAFCDAVVLVSAVRRTRPRLVELPRAEATSVLRRAWPMPELHPQRRHSPMARLLARRCVVAEARLTQQRHDILWLLESLQSGVDAWPLEGQEAGVVRRAG